MKYNIIVVSIVDKGLVLEAMYQWMKEYIFVLILQNQSEFIIYILIIFKKKFIL